MRWMNSRGMAIKKNSSFGPVTICRRVVGQPQLIMKLLYICSFLLLSASCSLHYKLILRSYNTHSPLWQEATIIIIYLYFFLSNNTSSLVKTKSFTHNYYSTSLQSTIWGYNYIQSNNPSSINFQLGCLLYSKQWKRLPSYKTYKNIMKKKCKYNCNYLV